MGIQSTFKALSDPTRRAILDLLKEGSMSAGDIGKHFSMTGATVSHHLAVLKEANLICDEKEGTFIYYELNMTVLDEILGWLSMLKGGENHE